MIVPGRPFLQLQQPKHAVMSIEPNILPTQAPILKQNKTGLLIKYAID